MLPKIIATLVANITRVLGRSLQQAVKEEFAASQQAAQTRKTNNSSESVSTDYVHGMSLDEAKMILNITDISDIEKLNQNYKHLFDMTDKSKGGSLYLQSKVYRAKERIDSELKLHKSDI